VKAVAWRPNEAVPGALKVKFFGLFTSDYLVFGLDDVDYQWALVGNNSRKYLWFLSRTPEVAPELLEKMKGMAEAQGYDLSKLYIVPQKAR
jgi:apolipoprotein D and lipocalin family protein